MPPLPLSILSQPLLVCVCVFVCGFTCMCCGFVLVCAVLLVCVVCLYFYIYPLLLVHPPLPLSLLSQPLLQQVESRSHSASLLWEKQNVDPNVTNVLGFRF